MTDLPELARELERRSREIELPFDYDYDTWVLAKESMRFVAMLVRTLAPGKVVEFGSGLSTRLFAIELAGGGRVLSLDHMAEYAAKTQTAVAALESRCDVQVLHRPIRFGWFHGKLLPFYRISSNDRRQLETADLVLADGPPGRWGREAALYVMFPLMRRGAMLLLDDAGRPAERRSAAAWQSYYGDAIEFAELPNLGKGALLVRKLHDAPGGRRFTLEEKRQELVRTLHAAWRNRPGVR
jgi:predicted O-methyltransferase YrrM